MSWTPEQDARLRDLAAAGQSYAAIAAQIGMTKNAVVGRAFRLGLGKPRAEQRAEGRGAGLPPETEAKLRRMWDAGFPCAAIGAQIGMHEKVVWGWKRRLGLPERDRMPPPSAPRAVPVAPAAPVAPVAPVARPVAAARHECRWIEGEPRGAQSRFCAAPAQRGSSYCAAHHALCWRPFTSRGAA